jgi:hypothetical protein
LTLLQFQTYQPTIFLGPARRLIDLDDKSQLHIIVFSARPPSNMLFCSFRTLYLSIRYARNIQALITHVMMAL